MLNPILLLNSWIEEEKSKGAPNPNQAVLSTVGSEGVPHSRVVAIREIIEDRILFFTQKGTRKVSEMQFQPQVSLVFWFELMQREVIVEGIVNPLSLEQNVQYWQTYPKEAQMRFCSYAPTSSQVIQHKSELQDKLSLINREFKDKTLPMSEYYCGFEIKIKRLIFYAYRLDELSDVFEWYLKGDNHLLVWHQQCLSP